MSRLSDEQFKSLAREHLGYDALPAAEMNFARAVADAAVQAARERQEQREHDLVDRRCESCGYMTYHREHMGCIRATPPASPVPEGYVLVPVEPTPEMVQAGYDASWDGDVTDEQMFAAVYRAMLAEAPKC